MNTQVWMVTGASQGLGLTLVHKLLQQGYKVAATSRNAATLRDAVQVKDDERFLPLATDINNPDSIQQAIDNTIKTFGRIDVLVNNAGYGMSGILEETGDKDISSIFSVNVLGTIGFTKAALPQMRIQGSGYIINISSVAGFVGAPGWSVYSATKAAVTAFTNVMALDVKELGIRLTSVQPSGFRTGFLTEDSLATTPPTIDAYTVVKQTQDRYLAMNGRQPGDPEKAAEIMIALANNPNPPLNLFLGEDAYNRASQKLAAIREEIEQWKDISISADFKKGN